MKFNILKLELNLKKIIMLISQIYCNVNISRRYYLFFYTTFLSVKIQPVINIDESILTLQVAYYRYLGGTSIEDAVKNNFNASVTPKCAFEFTMYGKSKRKKKATSHDKTRLHGTRLYNALFCKYFSKI